MLKSRQSSTGSTGKPNEDKDEFAALNLDRLKKSELKTQEQVRRHSIDVYLENRIIDRALHILSAGEEIQKISVVKDLPSLLEEDPAGCLQRVIPRIQQTLPSGSTEYNMAACTAVQNIAQQSLISPQNFTKTFLQVILNSVESQDTVAADAWLSTLLDVIDVLPSTILQTEVFPVFASKAHISKPVRVRIISCRVLGRLAALLPSPVVTKDILPVIISLCQDPYGKVRASMCQELPCISQLVGQDSNKYLLNCILDLANDEDSSVKEASLDSIAQLIPFIPLSSIKSLVIPLTKKLFSLSIEAEDGLIVAVAHFFGQYCIRLKDYLPLTDKAWFVARYVHLSQLNTTNRKKSDDYRLAISSEEEELNQRLTQCRVQCAYNFPAMVAFTADLKPEFSEKLPVVLKNLSSDSYYLVRKSIACGYHELFKLQPRWMSLLIVEFMKLLKDENEHVLEGLVPNISKILSIICEGSACDKIDAAQSLLTCELMLFESLNWRLHSDFLAQLQIIPKCFPPDFVNQHFVPLFMQRSVNSRALPCKMAAVKIILLIMSDEAQAKQKHRMRSQLLELCNSFNFYSRMVFVRAITLLIDISPKILKELFFHNIIAMTEDKIPNIRLAVCKIMPKLKAIAYEPYDRRLIAALESSVRRLMDEKDKDVLEQIKIMHFEFDELDRSKRTFRTNRDSDISNPSSLSASPSKHMALTQTPCKPLSSDKSPVLRSRSVPPTKGVYPVAQFPTAPLRPYPSPSPSPSRVNSKPVPATRPLARRLDNALTSDAFLIDTGISMPTANSSSKSKQELKPPESNMAMTKCLTEVFKSSSANKTEKSEIDKSNAVNNKIQIYSANILKPIRRLPTPRPTHRFSSFGCLSNNAETIDLDKPDTNSNLVGTGNTQEKVEGLLVGGNKNSSVLKVINKKLNEKPSGLPLKVNQTNKLLTENVICENLSNKDFYTQIDLKNKYRERFKLQQNQTTDTKKRHSLDVDTISNKTLKTPNKYTNINKRYSLTVEIKKDTPCKNSLAYNNNNNVLENTKLTTLPSSSTNSATRHQPGQPRPQSCILKNNETEIFNNSKRSVSVENLPPKSIRSASRLPVRAIDPKTSKPK